MDKRMGYFSEPVEFCASCVLCSSQHVIIDDPAYPHGRCIINLKNGTRNWNKFITWFGYVRKLIKVIVIALLRSLGGRAEEKSSKEH